MKYFAVEFPNHTTLIMKVDLRTKNIPEGVEWFTNRLSEARGIFGHGDIVYNPKQFLSVSAITNVTEKHERVARDFNKVVF